MMKMPLLAALGLSGEVFCGSMSIVGVGFVKIPPYY